MSTWVIGDVHGCYKQLKRLFKRLDFDRSGDALWLTGDLVNRGPDSVKVLRWCRKKETQLGTRFRCVLGNHDLHALAVHHGVNGTRPGDTLDELLVVDDRDELFDWLADRPFLVRRKGTLLVHAGILPQWTVEEARAKARKLRRQLRSGAKRFIREEMDHNSRLALAAMTRMRTLNNRGEPDRYSGSLEDIPRGLMPWFRFPGRRTSGTPIVCGHWAAAGFHEEHNVTLLDTACVWGGWLTAYRLEDGRIVEVPGLGHK